MALVAIGAASKDYEKLNEAAKVRFNIQWARDGCGVVEAGCAFLHDHSRFYSMYGQKSDFVAFLDRFAEALSEVTSNVYIVEKGDVELGKSPEYFDEVSLRTKYPEFQVLNISIGEFFDREMHRGIPIYVANKKWEELIDDDILHFRSMILKTQERVRKYGLREGANGMAMIGLSKPPPIAGYLEDKKKKK